MNLISPTSMFVYYTDSMLFYCNSIHCDELLVKRLLLTLWLDLPHPKLAKTCPWLRGIAKYSKLLLCMKPVMSAIHFHSTVLYYYPSLCTILYSPNYKAYGRFLVQYTNNVALKFNFSANVSTRLCRCMPLPGDLHTHIGLLYHCPLLMEHKLLQYIFVWWLTFARKLLQRWPIVTTVDLHLLTSGGKCAASFLLTAFHTIHQTHQFLHWIAASF